MKKLRLWLIFTFLGGLLYRIGGWIKTQVRDIGVSLLFCLYLGILAYFKGELGLWQRLSFIPCFGAMWGSLTTYRYFFPKPKDYTWWHYAMHGFFCSLSAIFFAWASDHWFGFGLRVTICTIFIAGWYFIAKWNDWLHEFGRGAVLIATTPLCLI